MRKSVQALVFGLTRHVAMATVFFPIVAGAAPAGEQPCLYPGKLVPISGKILTNAVAPGETLGVLVANIDGSIKLKCGLQGRAFFNADSTLGGFVHTLVCDDAVLAENGVDMIHSQAVSVTHFDGPPNVVSCGIPGVELQSGTFREVSYPQSGRGLLSPTGGGRLDIDGVTNCAGGIEMKYRGEVCLVR